MGHILEFHSLQIGITIVDPQNQIPEEQTGLKDEEWELLETPSGIHTLAHGPELKYTLIKKL